MSKNAWGFPASGQLAPQAVPQAVPQAAPYANSPQSPIPGQAPGSTGGRVQQVDASAFASRFAQVTPGREREPFLSYGTDADPHIYIVSLTHALDVYTVAKKQGARGTEYRKAHFDVLWTPNGTSVAAGKAACSLWMEDEYGMSAEECMAFVFAVVGGQPTEAHIVEMQKPEGAYSGAVLGVAVRPSPSKKDPTKVYNKYTWKHVLAENQAQVRSMIDAEQITLEIGRQAILS